MSTVDQVFSDTIVRFQQWLQFLEHKESEYQQQLNRVRRQPTADVEAAVSAPETLSVPEAANPSDEDPWQ